MNNGDEAIAQLFIEEAAELLAEAEQALLMLESLPDDVESISRIFRCVHTLKGDAEVLGFETVAGFTHLLENLLDKLLKQELLVTGEITNILLASLDLLQVLVSELHGGALHDAALYGGLKTRIEAVSQPGVLVLTALAEPTHDAAPTAPAPPRASSPEAALTRDTMPEQVAPRPTVMTAVEDQAFERRRRPRSESRTTVRWTRCASRSTSWTA